LVIPFLNLEGGKSLGKVGSHQSNHSGKFGVRLLGKRKKKESYVRVGPTHHSP